MGKLKTLAGVGLPFIVGDAGAEMAVALQRPATGIAHAIYDLHNLVLWICFAIFVVVFVPMFYALWRHRQSKGHAAAQFQDHLGVEVAWTIVPVLILIGMAWPATLLVLDMKNVAGSDLTIKVTGRQWNWEYEYLDHGPRFTSALATPREQIDGAQPKTVNYLLEVDRPLVVPTGRKIRLVLTATDVIHSWTVPALGVKQDAVPGFIRETWFQVDQPGNYRGQCVELCGVGHAFMPIVVEAVTPERFAAWQQEQLAAQALSTPTPGKTYSLEELKAQGEQVYTARCAACHLATGLGVPGAFPALDRSPLTNGPIAAHLGIVFHGKPGTAMQAFGPQLSDLEIAAVVTFERNHWNNRTGDVLQPADVTALRR